MIEDLTETFFQMSGTNQSAHTHSNWHASTFIKTATNYLADLTSLDSKLTDLDKSMASSTQASNLGRGSKRTARARRS